MFPQNAFAGFLKCTGLPILPTVRISLLKNADDISWKKCFCCELCTHALINALSHLLCFVLGKIHICLLLCLYNSLDFVRRLWEGMSRSGMMTSEHNVLFCIWLFSTGIRWSWTMDERFKLCLGKAPSWPFPLKRVTASFTSGSGKLPKPNYYS